MLNARVVEPKTRSPVLGMIGVARVVGSPRLPSIDTYISSEMF
jgi:hypothetical protein